VKRQNPSLSRRALGLAGAAAGIASAAARVQPADAKCRKKRKPVQPEILHAMYGTVRIAFEEGRACTVRLEGNQAGPVCFGEDDVPVAVPETALIPGPLRGPTAGLLYQVAGRAAPTPAGAGAAGSADTASWSIHVTGGAQDAATGSITLNGQIVAGEIGSGEVILTISSVIAFVPYLLPPLPPMPGSVPAEE